MKCPKCDAKMFHILESAKSTAYSCWRCGLWHEASKVTLPMSEMIMTGKKAPLAPMKDCPVVGCEEKMLLANDWPMCSKCRTRMRKYAAGAKTTKPPIMEINGELWLRDKLQ